MAIAPEYCIQTQVQIPITLAGLHNFIHIHDPNDFANNGPDAGGPSNPMFTLCEVDGDEHHDFHAEELGWFISTAEKSRAAEFRDTIADAMWAQYIVESEDDKDGL
jgi:hypothetical protein